VQLMYLKHSQQLNLLYFHEFSMCQRNTLTRDVLFLYFSFSFLQWRKIKHLGNVVHWTSDIWICRTGGTKTDTETPTFPEINLSTLKPTDKTLGFKQGFGNERVWAKTRTFSTFICYILFSGYFVTNCD
jgi:hypothetical protein